MAVKYFVLRWKEHCFAPLMIHCWSTFCSPYKNNHSFYTLVDWNLNQPILEDKARYAGLLFWPLFGHFWFPVVTLVTFSNNLSKRKKKKSKISKNLKNPKKMQKTLENSKKKCRKKSILLFLPIEENSLRPEEDGGGRWRSRKSSCLV